MCVCVCVCDCLFVVDLSAPGSRAGCFLTVRSQQGDVPLSSSLLQKFVLQFESDLDVFVTQHRSIVMSDV